MTQLCWEQWIKHFQVKGYNCIAPAWPGRDKPVDILRKSHPDSQLGKLTLSNIVAGRTHFILGQTDWEEVADYTASWLNDNGI